jgi:hypothetical protein
MAVVEAGIEHFLWGPYRGRFGRFWDQFKEAFAELFRV